jgi:tetratricopeptide (TPR) repeat protein
MRNICESRNQEELCRSHGLASRWQRSVLLFITILVLLYSELLNPQVAFAKLDALTNAEDKWSSTRSIAEPVAHLEHYLDETLASNIDRQRILRIYCSMIEKAKNKSDFSLLSGLGRKLDRAFPGDDDIRIRRGFLSCRAHQRKEAEFFLLTGRAPKTYDLCLRNALLELLSLEESDPSPESKTMILRSCSYLAALGEVESELFWRARILLRGNTAKEKAESLKLLNTAIQQFPYNIDLLKMRCTIFGQLGKSREAQSDMRIIRDLEKSSRLVAEAKSNIMDGSIPKAKLILADLVSSKFLDKENKYDICDALYDLNFSKTDAAKMAEDLYSKYPFNSRFITLYAFLNPDSKDLAVSEELHKRALRYYNIYSDSGYVELCYNILRVQFRRNELSKAIETCKSIRFSTIASDEDYLIKAYARASEAYEKLGKKKEAIDILDAALRKIGSSQNNTNRSKVYATRAALFDRLGDKAAAKADRELSNQIGKDFAIFMTDDKHHENTLKLK